ncbi:flavin reductase family protein [Streptomyces sp. XD-27]|uniref:flavin reductase family protein n=1 Tax=Streptomyces sp. XD-27 TaxID=3062779 RepID=UPI0026F425A1|nr:flavin reductase family protein [Streptomyces sp. XD-27]WKX69489.1 flavin reductase family protein [Streptomyces sp. XD-27]
MPVADFRALMSAFPTGVAVVTTYGADGRPRGLTCSSLASVTADPPTLSVCLTTRGETLRALRAYGAFAVNLLHHGGQRAAEVFARPAANRFAEVEWCPSPDAGLPWLTRDAFAVADCHVSEWAEVGDHTVVMGEVTAVVQESGAPLLYGARGFAVWPGGEVPGPVPAREGVAS